MLVARRPPRVTAVPLARRLGTFDAVAIGVGSMIGAGIFAALGPAAAAAGSWLLPALAVAAVVAFCNATSTAQLAAQHPTSGGVYAYGRAELDDWWGFAAGWCFLVGKTASCAAMAWTVGAYAWPDHARPVAVLVVVVVTAIDLAGITRTAFATRVVVAVVGAVLLAAVVAGASSSPDLAAVVPTGGPSPAGLLEAAGILFFAFAGYARIATLGEEVRDPARTIPRAVVIAFVVVIIAYTAVAVTVLGILGADGVAGSPAPLAAAVAELGHPALDAAVRGAAVLASSGALLALLAGLSRTTLAMAREGDLPARLARIDDARSTPRAATLAIAAVIVILAATVDIREMIGFSSFGVLLYYAVANIAAARQRGTARRYPRILQGVGLLGCGALVVTLPTASVATGAAVVTLGLIGRVLVLRHRRSRRGY